MSARSLARRVAKAPGGRQLTAQARLALAAKQVVGSGVFDLDWYQRQTGTTFPRVLPAVIHYLREGRRAELSPCPWFESRWYQPDPRKRRSGADPLVSYMGNPRHRRTKQPHPLLNPGWYVSEHPEAALHPAGVLGHVATVAGPDAVLDITHLLEIPATTTVGAVRAVAEAAVDEWRAHEALRCAPRRTPDRDRAAEAALRRRVAGLEAPSPSAPGLPVVSVVMPVWNRATTLRAAVESVQAQTWTDWELIVVDDGSTDDSRNVLEGLAAFDDRIQVVHAERSGVSRARNTAIAAARGRYVAFLDSDNTWQPDFLDTMLRVMSADGLGVAYASLELHRNGAVSYRAFGGGREFLRLDNHVDLNVLIAETELVRKAGAFSEDLRRAVDYDLVLKLTELSPAVHVPVIGAVYSDEEEAADRISVREPVTWNSVVRTRHVIDWDAAAGAARVPGRLSVIIPARDDVKRVRRCIVSLLGGAHDELDVEVLVVDRGSARASSITYRGFGLADQRVRTYRLPSDNGVAVAVAAGLPQTTGEFVAVVDPSVRFRPGWSRPLMEALTSGDTLAVQPLACGQDGTTLAAGLTFPVRGNLPLPLLQGHPVEDVRTLGAHVEVPALDGPVFALRADFLLELRGLNALLERTWLGADLSLRLRTARAGRLLVATESVVDVPETDDAGGGERDDEIFGAAWAHREPEGEHLWDASGFRLAHTQVDVDPASRRRRLVPVVVRPSHQVVDGPAAGLPSLRWAIKTPAPAGERALSWGDWHLAQSLAVALRRLGQDVVVDSKEAIHRATSRFDDVEVVLRGLTRVEPDEARTSLLWVISHPELVDGPELAAYDHAFVASYSWAQYARDTFGVSAEPLLQCTDAQLFTPEAGRPDTGPEVLFIGNSRGIFRPSVQFALEAGADVTIYGGGWGPYVDAERIAAPVLANDLVPEQYASAGVVLNDHWDDMRESGFVSNRVFDVLATGGRLVSDRVDGMTDLFGSSVLTWEDPHELLDFFSGDVRELFPPEAERRELAETVRKEHSFDARARRLLDVALELHR